MKDNFYIIYYKDRLYKQKIYTELKWAKRALKTSAIYHELKNGFLAHVKIVKYTRTNDIFEWNKKELFIEELEKDEEI